MNIPNVYRKAVDGFIIPPRSFFQMFASASKGAVSLFQEENRRDFMNTLDKSIINESVIQQATAGPMMMLSLFHDLQNPLLKKYQFDPSQLLKGVGPALEQFHNVSGALENSLHKIPVDEETEETEEKEKEETSEKEDNSNINGMTKEENDAILNTIHMLQQQLSTEDNRASSIFKHDWWKEAEQDSDGLAGQLSRMLTKELFDINQLSTKTAFLLPHPTTGTKKLKFLEGSCTVNNVALLSARAFICEASTDEEDKEEESSSPRYQIVDIHPDGHEEEESSAGVAAQLEVLYDVTTHFVENADKETTTSDMETTVVSVALFEGWLHGGPEGQLRWRLALHRPAFEFPGMTQAAY